MPILLRTRANNGGETGGGWYLWDCRHNSIWCDVAMVYIFFAIALAVAGLVVGAAHLYTKRRREVLQALATIKTRLKSAARSRVAGPQWPAPAPAPQEQEDHGGEPQYPLKAVTRAGRESA